MTIETNFTAHNEYFRFLQARLNEATVLDEISDNLDGISDNVAQLKPTGSTEVHGQLATHAGDGWDRVVAPLAGHLERIAVALETRSDSRPRTAWPELASGGALFTLSLLAHLRLRLFDARPNDPKLAGANLGDEISQHLQQMPKEPSLAPLFDAVGKLLAGQDALQKDFAALFTPLSSSLTLRAAVSLRLAELVEVEYQLVNALSGQAWPRNPDPFDDSATATSARAKK